MLGFWGKRKFKKKIEKNKREMLAVIKKTDSLNLWKPCKNEFSAESIWGF